MQITKKFAFFVIYRLFVSHWWVELHINSVCFFSEAITCLLLTPRWETLFRCLVGFAYMEYIARNWVGISYLESALCIPFRIQFEFFKFILNCLLLVGWNFTRLFGNIWTCCSFARLHVFVYNYTHVGCCSYTITYMWELVLVNTGVRCHLHGLDILNWNEVKLF